MIERTFIQNGRGTGKTYTLMSLVREQISETGHDSVVVVLPDHSYKRWWFREWRARFGTVVPLPFSVVSDNLLPLRGRFGLVKAYVEDIDTYEDGIYDERLHNLILSLVEGGEILFTSGRNTLNQRTHSRIITKQELMAERLRRRERRSDREPSDRSIAILEAIAKETWQP